MKPLFSLRLLALLCLLWLAAPGAWAQGPAWQSALVVGAGQTADSYSFVTATATDASGNVYLAGDFGGTVRFGNITLTSTGSTDVFVAKLTDASSTGSFAWVQRTGGTANENATALAVSGTSVYVAGDFNSPTASFGSTTLTSAGSYDIFVAKLTDAGSTASFTWAQCTGGMSYDFANALAVSGTSVYMAGGFASPTASFGSTTLTNASSAGSADVFVTKLTDAGSTASFVWAQRAGSTGEDYAPALVVSGTSVYVAGGFASPTASFGSTSLTSAGRTDAFVAKLTEAGSTASFTWAQRAGGTDFDGATALVMSGTSVYVAGSFTSPTASFGSTSLTSAGSSDVFVAKLTDAGNTASFAWAQRAGGTNDDGARALAVSGTSVYVAGRFASPTASFGSTTLTNTSSAGSADVFVAQLTEAGSTASFTWAQRAGGTNGDVASALAVSGTSVYVAGGFERTASFSTTTLTNPISNTSFGFLAALTDPLLTATTPPLAGADLALYPNPAQTTATLGLPAGLGTAEATLTLADALGRVVRTQALAVPAAGRRYGLDLRGLAPGIYALRVQAGTGAAVRRLVVE